MDWKPMPYTDLTRSWFRDLWDRADESTIDRMLTEDVIAHGLPGGDVVGKDAFRSFYREFRGEYPDVRIDLDVVRESGAYAFFIATAHLTTANRETYTLPGVGVARFEQDRVAEAWNGWDFLGLMAQQEGAEADAVAAEADAEAAERPTPE